MSFLKRFLVPFLILFIIFPFLFSCSVYSSSDYVEQFDSDEYKSLPYWHEFLNDGSVVPQNGLLLFSSGHPKKFPVLIGDFSDKVTDNSTFEIKFRYNSNVITQGAGIVFSQNSPNNGDLIDPNVQTNMAVWIWPRPNGSLMLNTNICTTTSINCSGDIFTAFSFPNDHLFHILKMERENLKYKIYLDGQLKIESIENSGKDIKYIWFGNTEITNTNQDWPIFEIDYVKIFNIQIPPAERVPVVVVPGLGASWDLEAILSAHDGSDWHIPDFVNVYDNLIKSLENAGYEQDKDLFIFAYDWRKDINNLGSDLDSFIQRLITDGKIAQDQKINLIGHSLGGLVARSYSQHMGTDKINKIITAGSPHLGAVNTYGLWEGAEIWGWPWWQRAAMALIVQLNKEPGESSVDTVRRMAPGVKDLLPVFDYLKNNNDQIIAWTDMNQTNSNLTNLNQNISEIDQLLYAWSGTSKQTREFLKVKKRSWLDRIEGRWEDGKPTETLFTNIGDGTVLVNSAKNSFSNTGTADLNHLGTISEKISIEKIMEELSLDNSLAEAVIEPDNRENVFIAALRSPGKLKICQESVCDDQLGIMTSTQKVFFLPGYADNNLTIEVLESGDGLGNYDLYLGRLINDGWDWEQISGQIETLGEVDHYPVTVTNNKLIISLNKNQITEEVVLAANELNRLVPNWDKLKLIKIATNQNLKNDKRVQAIQMLRLELSKIIIKNQKSENNQVTETAIDLWKKLDRLAESLYQGNGNVSRNQYKLIEMGVSILNKMITNYLIKSDNFYVSVLYRMAENLIEKANVNNKNLRGLAVDQLQSASLLLTTAKLIR